MEKRKWKIGMGIVAALIAMMNLVPMVSAAETASISVTVTVSYLSISLNQSTVGFGYVKNGTSTVSSSSVNVTNDGNWPINLTLKQTCTSGSCNWTIGTTTGDVGTDKYVLAGIFNTTITAPPVVSSFTNDTVITASTAVTNSTNFGSGNGFSIGADSSRYLWLLFNAPTTTTQKNQQNITVTVGAVAA